MRSFFFSQCSISRAYKSKKNKNTGISQDKRKVEEREGKDFVDKIGILCKNIGYGKNWR